ncbi:hypothetical protein [Streptomyces sp. CBMA152]|uniref:hypothetical protein n=1 Tax=Streptomyces sp. CBMA152 TaxID=1896312 RepID=UPI0016600FE4|nr:hypothetical protein [Streptomyces sp. CBMA152]MBD0743010.1 hypothetical protein [Streptomyces sp. CBMA152]
MLSYLELALKQAARSRCRYRVGAVLVKSGRVLTHSPNRYRNAPAVDFLHATFHAEEMLLRRAQVPPGAVVYVARINRAGAPALARPCPRCEQALRSRGVTLAHFTTAQGPGSLHLT